MKIKLVKIIEGAVYENFVWDYWLLIQLSNNQVIKIFDRHRLCLSMKEDEIYNIKLVSDSVSINLNLDSLILFGDLINVNDELYFKNPEFEIELCNEKLDELKDIYLSIGRLDLENISHV